MTISEMHELFRTLGQQMGMQTIRAVLPEEIDKFLNATIVEKVRSVLVENTTLHYNNLLAVQQKGTSPINALRTLYAETTNPTESNVFVYLGVSVKYGIDNVSRYCRIIDNVELENVLNDYCSAPSEKYPIAVFTTSGFDIYPNDESGSPIVSKTIKYIKNPAVVNKATNTDCDLPSYLHTEIVNTAVNKFFASVGYTTHVNKTDKTNNNK